MKILAFYLLFAVSPLSLVVADQPKINAIKFLVADLSKKSLWTNGIFLPLYLSKDASFKQLTAAYLKEAKFDRGAINDYSIEEAEDCEIPPNSRQFYKIVRISSDQGGKFLIFRYDESASWWTKCFDAKEQYQKAVAAQGATANP